jgi:hypothetical protein
MGYNEFILSNVPVPEVLVSEILRLFRQQPFLRRPFPLIASKQLSP